VSPPPASGAWMTGWIMFNRRINSFFKGTDTSFANLVASRPS